MAQLVHMLRWWQGCTTQSRSASMQITQSFSLGLGCWLSLIAEVSPNCTPSRRISFGTGSEGVRRTVCGWLRVLESLRYSRWARLSTIGRLPDRGKAILPILSRKWRTEVIHSGDVYSAFWISTSVTASTGNRKRTPKQRSLPGNIIQLSIIEHLLFKKINK